MREFREEIAASGTWDIKSDPHSHRDPTPQFLMTKSSALSTQAIGSSTSAVRTVVVTEAPAATLSVVVKGLKGSAETGVVNAVLSCEGHVVVLESAGGVEVVGVVALFGEGQKVVLGSAGGVVVVGVTALS
jgi:hypothetical protein